MTYIQRLWITIFGKSKHSIYLFLLVFLFAMLGVVACYFRNISDSYQQSVISDIGYSLMLYRTDENSIEQELLDDICNNVEGVLGYNQENNMLITPVNFQNAIAKDETNIFSIPQSDMVRLFANTNTTLSPVFSNHMRLLKRCEVTGILRQDFTQYWTGLLEKMFANHGRNGTLKIS